MANLSGPARRYLLHATLLTFGLAISGLFYNLLIVGLGYDRLSFALPLAGEVSLLGILNSLPVLTAGLCSVPIWWLVSRFGSRPALIASALLAAISLLGTALWSEPTALLAAAAIGGPASVLFQVSAAPFMMRHSGPTERDMLFSLNAGLNIGVAGLGSLVGGFVPGIATALFDLAPQSPDAYRATFAVAAGCTALAALPLLYVGRRTTDDGRRATGNEDGTTDDGRRATDEQADNRAPDTVASGRATGGWSSVVGRLPSLAGYVRGAIPFMVAPLLISCGAALLIPFLNLYFRQRFGAPDATLGVIFAAIGVATGAATLAAPLLSRRLGKLGSVVLTQTLAIPCLLLLGLAPTLWLAVTVALFRGSLMNMASPLYDAFAMERSPEAARPMVIGLINGAFAAGYVVGPTVSAEVQQRYGFGPLFVATAAFYACAVAATALIFWRHKA
jgi:MFS family permease